MTQGHEAYCKIFRKSTLDCAIIAELIDFDGAHVDHYNPIFIETIELFLDKYHIKSADDLFPLSKDNQTGYSLVDLKLIGLFYEFMKIYKSYDGI